MDAYGKVGLYYDEKEEKWYLPIGEAPSTHIVKQSHVRLKKIVANEQMCLLTAKYLGIEIPESFIVTTGGDDETVLFATKRYDRKFIKENNILNRFMNWRIKLWLSFRKKCEICSIGGRYLRQNHNP